LTVAGARTKRALVLRAVAAGAGADKSREMPAPRGTHGLEGFHLEAIHHAVALVREAERALPPAPTSQPALGPGSQPATRPAAHRPRPSTRPGPAAPPTAPAAEPWHLELAGGAMALYRPDGVDPLVRGSGRLGLWRGLGLRGAIGLAPSWADGLTVFDLSFQSGASWRFALTPSLHLEPGLLAGVLQHLYTLAPGDTVLEWAFLGNLTLELGWRLHRYVGLRLWLAPGLTSRALSHPLPVPPPNQETWRRSLFRLEAGACGVLIIR